MYTGDRTPPWVAVPFRSPRAPRTCKAPRSNAGAAHRAGVPRELPVAMRMTGAIALTSAEEGTKSSAPRWDSKEDVPLRLRRAR